MPSEVFDGHDVGAAALRTGHVTHHVPERTITLEEPHGADEVLSTGAGRGVVPIVAIDGRPVGDGAVGPHARALFTAFAAHDDGYVAARRGRLAKGT